MNLRKRIGTGRFILTLAAVSSTLFPVRVTTWGRVKSRYKEKPMRGSRLRVRLPAPASRAFTRGAY